MEYIKNISKKSRIWAPILVACVCLILSPIFLVAGDDHDHKAEAKKDTTVQKDLHENCNHGAEENEEAHIEGEDPDHDHDADADNSAEVDGHDDHEDELVIELTPEAVSLVGLKTSTVAHGRIGSIIELPGEVGFNEDKVAHISPRFAGIAQKAMYRIGDYVESGSTMAVVESNESMNSYTITAPMSGWVIDRHINPGEFVSEENSIYMIADLSTVWVNLAVYPKDIDKVKAGQEAQIETVGGTYSTHGTIDYITPIIDFRTRSATARITLPNPNNAWRPGTFVQASVASEGKSESLLVEKDAIQYLDGHKVVFLTDGPNRFTPVEVMTGESDNRYTHVISGLSEGAEYVSKGAFELKAKIVTSNLDAHAGHGH